MAKRFLISVFVILFCDLIYAKNYDLSQIDLCKTVSEYSVDTTVDQMDTVTFGSYPQSDTSGNYKEPIEWIVLEKQGDKAFLLSKYILDCKDYNNILKDCTWEVCSLRNWLNNVFYNVAFNDYEKRSVLSTKLENIIDQYSYFHSLSGGKWENGKAYTTAGNDTIDKVFCLSLDEHFKYFDKYESGGGPRKVIKPAATRGTNYAVNVDNGGYNLYMFNDGWQKEWDIGNSPYWLRSPSEFFQDAAKNVDVDGQTFGGGLDVKLNESESESVYDGFAIGVRPALWVDISSFKSQNNVLQRNTGNTNSSNTSDKTSAKNGWFGESYYRGGILVRNDWLEYGDDWYYVGADGITVKNQWIQGKYLGSDGKMYKGRQTPDGKYVGDDGSVVNVEQDFRKSIEKEAAKPDSWYQTQGGLWYYFENDRTTTKRGWFKDKRDNQVYYLDPATGIMQVGWLEIDGDYYYFNESHDNSNNWYEIGDGYYESHNRKVKAYGSMFKSEKTPDGYWVNYRGKYVKNGNFLTVMNPMIWVGIIAGIILIISLLLVIKKKTAEMGRH